MGKLIISLALCALTFNINAQIMKEHSYISSQSGYDLFNPVFENIFKKSDGVGYVLPNPEGKNFKLYNIDHSIAKETFIDQIDSLPNYSLQTMFYFTTKFFNNDDKVEFLVCWGAPVNDIYYLYLYDEDGKILFEFGEVYSYYRYANDEVTNYFYFSGESYKVIIRRKDDNQRYSKYDVYSVGGTFNKSNEIKMTNLNPAFPNPAKITITIPYKLNEVKESMMSIYNMAGQLIEQKRIDDHFDNILLDVSNYKSGLYIYKYDNIAKQFVVE